MATLIIKKSAEQAQRCLDEAINECRDIARCIDTENSNRATPKLQTLEAQIREANQWLVAIATS